MPSRAASSRTAAAFPSPWHGRRSGPCRRRRRSHRSSRSRRRSRARARARRRSPAASRTRCTPARRARGAAPRGRAARGRRAASTPAPSPGDQVASSSTGNPVRILIPSSDAFRTVSALAPRATKSSCQAAAFASCPRPISPARGTSLRARARSSAAAACGRGRRTLRRPCGESMQAGLSGPHRILTFPHRSAASRRLLVRRNHGGNPDVKRASSSPPGWPRSSEQASPSPT